MSLIVEVGYRTLFFTTPKPGGVPAPTDIVDKRIFEVAESYAISSGPPPPPVVEFQSTRLQDIKDGVPKE